MKSNSLSCVARRHAAFTLIELLVVIAIIAILAGLLLMTAGMVQDKAARARADAEIHAISSELESYKLDFGTYPQDITGGTNSTKVLVEELAYKPLKFPSDYNNKKPFEFPLKMLSKYKSGTTTSYEDLVNGSTLMDPFGNEYRYYFDPTKADDPSAQNPISQTTNNGPKFFDLWSLGKGGIQNEHLPAKWIKNW